MPADLVGTRIYNQKTGEFTTSLGPVFTNLLLADEINRAPAKVQSALLEVMQERQVTIAGETHRVPQPFLVMATQNPIETEGTYPLPEAQVDRFMMKVLVGYPTEEEEFVIVERVTGAASRGRRRGDDRPARRAAEGVPPRLRRSVADPVRGARWSRRRATRSASASRTSRGYLTFGASPRASIHLIEGARALAFLRGRSYALPEDVADLAPDVLRHRLVLSYEALAEGLTADAADRRVIMQHMPAPREAAGDPCPRSDPARLRRVLRRLEWTVIRRLDGALHGDYRTLFRGFGLDLADLREYQYQRRRAPHRLERHRAAADALRARVQRGPRGQPRGSCSTCSPSVDFGSQRVQQARRRRPSSSPCWRACSPATATASARCSTATASTR